MRRGYAKAEIKNAAAREALEPISPENRPRIVLIACAWLLVVAANIVYNGLAADGDSATTGRIGNVLMLILVLTALVGTYRLRYWAILGAQTIFALACIFGIVAAAVIPDLLVVLLVGAGALVSGVVFYRMINVMARVQKTELQRRGEL
jgi:peptidoglycan/LPS O-acetylase OafA/YrhL